MRTKRLLQALPVLAFGALTTTAAGAEETSPPLPSSPPAVAAPSPPAGAELKEHVLFGPGTRYGGYVAPELKVTSFTADYAVLAGGHVGLLLDRKYIIGLGGYGLTTSHSPVPALSSPLGVTRVGFGYGGLRLAYAFKPEKLVHASFGALIGVGGVTAMTNERTADAGDGDYGTRWRAHHGGAVFVAEPQTDLELNVHSHVRVAMTVGYRFVSGTDQPGFKASDMSGPALGLGVRLGWF